MTDTSMYMYIINTDNGTKRRLIIGFGSILAPGVMTSESVFTARMFAAFSLHSEVFIPNTKLALNTIIWFLSLIRRCSKFTFSLRWGGVTGTSTASTNAALESRRQSPTPV